MSNWSAAAARLKRGYEWLRGTSSTVADQGCQKEEKDHDESQPVHVRTCCMCEVFVKYEYCSGAFDTCMHNLICSELLPFFLSSLDEPGAQTYSNATAVIRRPASSGASMAVAKLARSLMRSAVQIWHLMWGVLKTKSCTAQKGNGSSSQRARGLALESTYTRTHTLLPCVIGLSCRQRQHCSPRSQRNCARGSFQFQTSQIWGQIAWQSRPLTMDRKTSSSSDRKSGRASRCSKWKVNPSRFGQG